MDKEVQYIEWDQITQVVASERNSKEFTLSVSSGKKKAANNAYGGTFHCKERDRLLTEMIHILHVKAGGQASLSDRVWLQTDIFNEDKKKGVHFYVHPTMLQIDLKRKVVRKPQE